MKKLLDLVKNLSVSWKFVLAYYAILIVPMMLSGIYVSFKTSKAAIEQAKLVMEQNLLQTRASILQKVNIIENISQLISSDKNVRTILGNQYNNEVHRVEDYQFEISPFIVNILRLNNTIYSMRFYTSDSIITEMMGSYYSIIKVNAPEWFESLSERKPTGSGWVSSHDAVLHALRPKRNNIEQVFSFNSEIRTLSTNKSVGMLEIEVSESVMFDVLRDPVIRELGEVFVVDRDGVIVSNSIAAFYKKNIIVRGFTDYHGGQIINRVQKMKNGKSIVIAIPIDEIGCSIVGIFPVDRFNKAAKSSQHDFILVLILSSLLLGIIIYFITNVLLSRIKKLVKAMKQVREGNLDVSVPMKTKDEFGELALTFNHMTARIHDLIETVYKIQIMEREAELKVLEAQINPHFLYNTLATISWVARRVNSPEIVKISNSLAKFYRLVLNKGRTLITVKEEVHMLKAYLDIQKIRFESMFDIVYEIDEGIYDYKIVKNILQPIVENALTHGIEPKRSHGTIIVKAGERDSKLFFQIIDDGVGMNSATLRQVLSGKLEKGRGSGYAVKNIMERLKAYYGSNYSFDIFSRCGIGTVITVTVCKID